jgi:PKD repeat protein
VISLKKLRFYLSGIFILLVFLAGVVQAVPTPPAEPVKLIFIHHSTGENWLKDTNGGLGIALRDNNYFVSDTNYGWGTVPKAGFSPIGSYTDIGHWWMWFRGPKSQEITNALFSESDQHSVYSRPDTDPGGKNQIVIFKSCFPNSNLRGNPDDPVPSIDANPLKGLDSGSQYHTVANAKGIYIDLLPYFEQHQDTLFVVITAPPLSNATYSDNARAFNQWLVNDWLLDYPYRNVAVFDFYNVLTTNGGSAKINDLGSESGNHHRWWQDAVQHTVDTGSGEHDTNAYASAPGDDHPGRAGNLKATAEFIPLLNLAYNRWHGADFTADATTGTAPLTVQFTGIPAGNEISSWNWDFTNDGTTDSTLQSPEYTFTSAGNYTVNLTVTGNEGAESVLKADYIYLSEDPITSLTVTSPEDGESWQRGTSHPVTWRYTGSPGPTVKITLLKAGVEVGVISSSVPVGTAGTGSYAWPISQTGATGSDYRVSVRSISQPAIKGSSTNAFTLTPAGAATPAITVISPNGGETWQRGTPRTVTWSYTGSPGSTVKIMLLKGGDEVGTITSGTPVGSSGTGSYTWPISSEGLTGSDFMVSVQSTSQPAIKDSGNNHFTISQAGTTNPSITVTSPGGGETWQRGTSQTVAWSYTGDPGSMVKIMLLKGGAEVGTIVGSTSAGSGGTGSYTWPISLTGRTGSDFKVSVQSTSQPALKDTSNNNFTLTPAAPALTVISPNGGETWQRGTSHSVTWSYTGSPGSTVRITLLKAGVEVGTINSSVSVGTSGSGSYTWPVSSEGLTGSDFRVRVQGISQPTIFDTGNNFFTLTL